MVAAKYGTLYRVLVLYEYVSYIQRIFLSLEIHGSLRIILRLV